MLINFYFCRQVEGEKKSGSTEPAFTHKIAICQMAGWKTQKASKEWKVTDANVQIYFNLIINKE